MGEKNTGKDTHFYILSIVQACVEFPRLKQISLWMELTRCYWKPKYFTH